ncbi:patatin-like phospholipase family protein [Nocardia sp. NPDC020380]|uniref:patatin-like phospholipase family protein n=1 Tax=Nocardia sp. NPDC020380 TaxID=3364309 RepID=UPI0037ACDB08
MQIYRTVRILAGGSGRYLPMMAGMLSGAVDFLAPASAHPDRVRPVLLGVSGGAVAAAAAALDMPAHRMREIAAEFRHTQVLGRPSLRSLWTERTLYPAARVREVAHAVVGDRTFADFVLPTESRRQPGIISSLMISVYSSRHGTLFLPQDLWRLRLHDMPVADALVAATRVPGALPAAPGLEDLFDGGLHHRVPYEVFLPEPALLLDLYSPKPYSSRGGVTLPIVHPALPMIWRRPRPFRDDTVRERTIFAGLPYGSALRPPGECPCELFDRGRALAASWLESRSRQQLLALADSEVVRSPVSG